MIGQLQNIISKVFYPPTVNAPTVVTPKSNNPFANPFMQNSVGSSSQYYGKNSPVKGGFFAGYYNNKPNIVGRRLFLEV